MSVFSALALMMLVVGPPNTKQPTLQLPSVKTVELPPSLAAMTSGIPFFVIANEKGELYRFRCIRPQRKPRNCARRSRIATPRWERGFLYG